MSSSVVANRMHDTGTMELTNDSLTVTFSLVDKVRVSLRVHWMPEEFCVRFLTRVFSKYGTVLSAQEEQRDEEYDRGCLLGTFEIGLELSYEDVEFIPHLLYVYQDSGAVFPLLVTMAGRQPLCLKCLEVGYTRRECSGPKRSRPPKAPQLAKAPPLYSDMVQAKNVNSP